MESVTCNDSRISHRVDESTGHAIVTVLHDDAPPRVEGNLGHVTSQLQRGPQFGLRGVVRYNDVTLYPVLPGTPRQGLGKVPSTGCVYSFPEIFRRQTANRVARASEFETTNRVQVLQFQIYLKRKKIIERKKERKKEKPPTTNHKST